METYGSFNWYRNLKELFFVNLTKAIMHADLENLGKIERIFPHIVMAHREFSWDRIPETKYPVTINVINRDPPVNHHEFNDIRRGSFNWYLFHSGHFVTYLANVIYQSDDHNLELISQQYPQMIAAFKPGRYNWNMCPDGFECSTYNSPQKTPQKTPS